ncbi:uncharacterized protein LOC117642852 isoform X2 [Thrips palmi]|uniref:Uncharacterized protein LOC117642852 isoform X2 n=1 Tax=Thrips palmi TaxID=161013 RepID=A0A6P8ZKM0_THRPL|nr:uncharacterized protein LOC117642852 isoform X2 [Thrips palmi]
MARVLLLVLALVAAASAGRYTRAQLAELYGRIDVCLEPVPQSGFNNQPANICKYDAKEELLRGYTKESQVDRITACLKRYEVPVADEVVAAAEECLRESLTKPVAARVARQLQRAQYTRAQLAELNGRIDVCLEPVPQSGFNNQPANICKYDAKEELLRGYTKESQIDRITACLKRYEVPVAADIVAAAEECLRESLTKPVAAEVARQLQRAEYTRAQLRELYGRIDVCLEPVPQDGLSNQPANICSYDAKEELLRGYTKESQVERITDCLKRYEVPVAADVVAAAEQCLKESLPKPVTA